MAKATAHPDRWLISSEDVQGTEVYGAGDQAIRGRVPEADMTLPQHERDRDRGAGRYQHPVRSAEIGDGAEEFARLWYQHLRSLEHERIDDEESEQHNGEREHDLLDQREVLETRTHGLSSDRMRAVLRRQCRAVRRP